MVAVDILRPLPVTKCGNRHVLVAAEYFTRWMEAWPIPYKEVKTVGEWLTMEMIYRFSVPTRLHSDQGQQFESEVLQEICRLLGILVNLLSIATEDQPTSWDKYVPQGHLLCL